MISGESAIQKGDYASGIKGGEGKGYKGVLIIYISMTCRVRGCWEITRDEVVRGGWKMAALTFLVGSPHRTKYSDKTKQVFSKESNLDSRG